MSNIYKLFAMLLLHFYMVNHINLQYNLYYSGGDFLSVSDAKKRAIAKYQRENISSIACRVKKAEAEKFKDYCSSIGKTPNAVLREFVFQCIEENAEPT